MKGSRGWHDAPGSPEYPEIRPSRDQRVEAVLERDPDSAQAHMQRSRLRLRHGDAEAAVELRISALPVRGGASEAPPSQLP